MPCLPADGTCRKRPAFIATLHKAVPQMIEAYRSGAANILANGSAGLSLHCAQDVPDRARQSTDAGRAAFLVPLAVVDTGTFMVSDPATLSLRPGGP